jgi:hypothetical protein
MPKKSNIEAQEAPKPFSKLHSGAGKKDHPSGMMGLSKSVESKIRKVTGGKFVRRKAMGDKDVSKNRPTENNRTTHLPMNEGKKRTSPGTWSEAQGTKVNP